MARSWDNIATLRTMLVSMVTAVAVFVTLQTFSTSTSSAVVFVPQQTTGLPALRGIGGGSSSSSETDLHQVMEQMTQDMTDLRTRMNQLEQQKQTPVDNDNAINNHLLSQIHQEWTDKELPTDMKANPQQIKELTSSIEVHIPGTHDTTKFYVPFFRNRPSWLSSRTFTSNIFFCPPNGHEGTITHLIGQLLWLQQQESNQGSFFDVGSNLGFYSLLAMDMGVQAYAFDIQPVCLFNLYSLAQTSPKSNNLHLYNVGMADVSQVVTNAEGGCDYENFYVSDTEQRQDKVVDAKKAGFGVQVPIVPFDDWMEHMTALTSPSIPLPIRVLKMDTEGAEGRIILGMAKTLASCNLRNWIVELTPSHWHRFGQAVDDKDATQAYIDVVEKYNFKAYLMYMPENRQPPPSLHNFMKPLDHHPANGLNGQTGTGCENAPYYEILDMRRFFVDFCLGFQASVKRPGGSAKGFCGNVWFQKQGCDN